MAEPVSTAGSLPAEAVIVVGGSSLAVCRLVGTYDVRTGGSR